MKTKSVIKIVNMLLLLVISGCHSGSTTTGNNPDFKGGIARYLVDENDQVYYAEIYFRNGNSVIIEPYGDTALQQHHGNHVFKELDLQQFYDEYFKNAEIGTKSRVAAKRFGFVSANYGFVPGYGTAPTLCYQAESMTRGQTIKEMVSHETINAAETIEKTSFQNGVSVATASFQSATRMSYGHKFTQTSINMNSTFFQWYIMPLEINYNPEALLSSSGRRELNSNINPHQYAMRCGSELFTQVPGGMIAIVNLEYSFQSTKTAEEFKLQTQNQVMSIAGFSAALGDLLSRNKESVSITTHARILGGGAAADSAYFTALGGGGSTTCENTQGCNSILVEKQKEAFSKASAKFSAGLSPGNSGNDGPVDVPLENIINFQLLPNGWNGMLTGVNNTRLLPVDQVLDKNNESYQFFQEVSKVSFPKEYTDNVRKALNNTSNINKFRTLMIDIQKQYNNTTATADRPLNLRNDIDTVARSYDSYASKQLNATRNCINSFESTKSSDVPECKSTSFPAQIKDYFGFWTDGTVDQRTLPNLSAQNLILLQYIVRQNKYNNQNNSWLPFISYSVPFQNRQPEPGLNYAANTQINILCNCNILNEHDLGFNYQSLAQFANWDYSQPSQPNGMVNVSTGLFPWGWMNQWAEKFDLGFKGVEPGDHRYLFFKAGEPNTAAFMFTHQNGNYENKGTFYFDPNRDFWK